MDFIGQVETGRTMGRYDRANEFLQENDNSTQKYLYCTLSAHDYDRLMSICGEDGIHPMDKLHKLVVAHIATRSKLPKGNSDVRR